MNNLENKIESILFFKNEPVSLAELGKILGVSQEVLKPSIANLQDKYKNRGIVLVTDGEYASFGTHPDASELIEGMLKDELSRELGQAGLETLAIVAYKGPVSRREIDYVRGVNSSYILRNLTARGLVERVGDTGRSYSYKPTLKLLEHLGISALQELPEYETAFAKMEEFAKSGDDNKEEQ